MCKYTERNIDTHSSIQTKILIYLNLYRQKYWHTCNYTDICNYTKGNIVTHAIMQTDIPPHPSCQIVEAEGGNQEWWGGDGDKVNRFLYCEFYTVKDTVHWTQYTVYCILHTVYYSVYYTVYFKLCTVHHTLCTLYCKMSLTTLHWIM